VASSSSGNGLKMAPLYCRMTGWGQNGPLAHTAGHELNYLALSVSAQALDAHCLGRIARVKRPKRYHFIESLPNNSYGKVLKREPRERLARAEDRR
jgi:acyl-CoA synthetase (AMP-forming)/AMP-acid ligase II